MTRVDETRRTLATALAAGDESARREALEQLERLAPEDAGALVDDALAAATLVPLASARRSEQRRTAELLARVVPASPPLHAALRAALTASDARLRWGAAFTLGRALTPERALWPSARETMQLADGDQRWAAAELACAIARRDASVLAELRRARDDASPTLRKMALYCLRDLGDDDALPAARALLADRDAGVRLAALATLGRGDAAARDVAIAERVAALTADDPDAGVRRAAAATLAKLGVTSERVLAALRTAAAVQDPSLARAALGALRALGVPA